jgi:hypothetical protein
VVRTSVQPNPTVFPFSHLFPSEIGFSATGKLDLYAKAAKLATEARATNTVATHRFIAAHPDSMFVTRRATA